MFSDIKKIIGIITKNNPHQEAVPGKSRRKWQEKNIKNQDHATMASTIVTTGANIEIHGKE